MTWRRAAKRWGWILFVLALTLALVDRLSPVDLVRRNDVSLAVTDAEGGTLRVYPTLNGFLRLPTRASDIDPLYLEMLLAYEDHRFGHHPGVDPLALFRALGQFVANGRVISGGSTLTMQTVRLLEPHPRDLGHKLIEIERALALQHALGPEGVLDAYLTIAPMGGNLEGVRAASLAYFGAEPKHLTIAQAALLVALPQNPSRLRPDRFPEAARAARNKVIDRVASFGIIGARAAAEAKAEPVPARRVPAPFRAPHLSDRLIARIADRQAPGGPSRASIESFIDPAIQAPLEALAAREQDGLSSDTTLAFLVVETAGRQAVGYVGSGDYLGLKHAGEIDMVRAVRSPGSTLKPAIYGMGFDELIIHPETIIDDRPTNFGGYAPANFENSYFGQVSVREALQNSLNVPAVKVLARLGPSQFVARLRDSGVPMIFDKLAGAPGLPVALGGVGTTLEGLVTLYAGIADGGLVKPLRLTPEDPDAEGRRIFGAAADWYLCRILEDMPPPDQWLMPNDLRMSETKIAFKTGTSYGYRDAWAIGWSHGYTVGVWVGRPDGSPSPGRFGRNTAAPLLFSIFDFLPAPPDGYAAPVIKPAGVIEASNQDLPPALRRFEAPEIVKAPRAIDATGVLTIEFPKDGAEVEIRPEEPLMLEASGGIRPLHWLVNGRPIESSAIHRDASWMPDRPGRSRIAVIDAEGRSAAIEVDLRPPMDLGGGLP